VLCVLSAALFWLLSVALSLPRCRVVYDRIPLPRGNEEQNATHIAHLAQFSKVASKTFFLRGNFGAGGYVLGMPRV